MGNNNQDTLYEGNTYFSQNGKISIQVQAHKQIPRKQYSQSIKKCRVKINKIF